MEQVSVLELLKGMIFKTWNIVREIIVSWGVGMLWGLVIGLAVVCLIFISSKVLNKLFKSK